MDRYAAFGTGPAPRERHVDRQPGLACPSSSPKSTWLAVVNVGVMVVVAIKLL